MVASTLLTNARLTRPVGGELILNRYPVIDKVIEFDLDDITTLDGTIGSGVFEDGYIAIAVEEHDPARSIVFWDIRGGGNEPNNSICRLIKESSTELRFAWAITGSLPQAQHVRGWIVQFERGVTVQDINEEIADQGVTEFFDIEIPNVVDRDKTFVLPSYVKSGSTWGNDDTFAGQLDSIGANYRIFEETGINLMTVSLQVVTMEGCFVDHILDSVTTSTATSVNGTTWSRRFPPERTMFIGSSTANTVSFFAGGLWAAFPDFENQRIVWERNTGTSGDFQWGAQIVRLPPGFRTIHGRHDHDSNESDVSSVLPFAVQAEWAISLTLGNVGQSMSKTADASDNFSDSRCLVYIDDSMNIRTDSRTTVGDVVQWAWQVILLPRDNEIDGDVLGGVLSISGGGTDFIRSATDTVAVAETRKVDQTKLRFDDAPVTETRAIDQTKARTDLIGVPEIRSVAQEKTRTDAITVIETTGISSGTSIVRVDAIDIFETRAIDQTKQRFDDIPVIEDRRKEQTIVRIDGVTVTEITDIVFSGGQNVVISREEFIGVFEARALDQTKQRADSIPVTEIPAKDQTLAREEIIDVFETTSIVTGISVVRVDLIDVTETKGVEFGYGRVRLDQVAVVETLVKEQTIARLVAITVDEIVVVEFVDPDAMTMNGDVSGLLMDGGPSGMGMQGRPA